MDWIDRLVNALFVGCMVIVGLWGALYAVALVAQYLS
jgi:hypothetical protein